MRVTRREFLASAAATVSLHRWRWRPSAPSTVLLDLEEHCSVRESLAGYRAAVVAPVLRAAPSTLPRGVTLIIPAAVAIPPAVLGAIATGLESGGRVLLESGAGFATERDVRAHRSVLRDALGIDIEAPVSLWAGGPAPGVPYVDFTWPMATKVRDFSRVVPFGGGAGETIARVHGWPVALRCRRGLGDLIVLGSPIGPALWAGDAEARNWLNAVVWGWSPPGVR